MSDARDIDHPPAAAVRAEAEPRWHSWLMLVWSMWIFLVPLTQHMAFPGWLWPTLASYALFLPLFYRVHFARRRNVLAIAATIAALGFVVTPWNPGAQGYLIYACAYLPFALPARRALGAMGLLLATYTGYWLWLGFPWMYSLSAIVIGPAVGAMNIHYERRRQADAALALSHEEVRRLAALAERERIGRDLHDLLGHTLSLVALKSELAARLIERDPPAARREIEEVGRVARDALAQVRSAVTGIRAAGLAAELASARLLLEADRIGFTYDVAPMALPPEIETVLALTVREAVTNIQRHARATSAHVCLRQAGRDAVLEIVDDGRGGEIAPGNGLRGMRERIEALGGRLRIDAASGRGTRIDVQLPIPAPAAIDAARVPAARVPCYGASEEETR